MTVVCVELNVSLISLLLSFTHLSGMER